MNSLDLGKKVIKDKIPQSFLKLMNEVQCKTIYKQISELEEENKIRVQNSEYLYNKIRMLSDPYPNAYIVTSDQKRLIIKKVEIKNR